MKRTDLREGAEYMFADRKYVAEAFSGTKVTLVDLGPFAESHAREPLALADLTVVPAPEGRYARGYRRADKGQLVAVRGLGHDGAVRFVRTATLICSWADAETGRERVRAQRKAESEQRISLASRRADLDRDLGVRLRPYATSQDRTGRPYGLFVRESADRVELPTDVLLALLDAAEATK